MNLFSRLLHEIRFRRSLARPVHLDLEWKKRGGWLNTYLPENTLIVSSFPELPAIESRAGKTAQLGEFPLHESYGQTGATRNSDGVRSSSDIGRLYRWLVVERKPEVVVEFGTAFGVSGMYWLAGLETNHRGELLTFEVNEIWRQIAVRNLSAVGERFRSVAGAFEDKIDEALEGRQIDLAFIDAIHTSAWVLPQFEHVMRRAKTGALVAFDDVDFSEDMRAAWETVVLDPRTVAALAVRGHLGLVEISGGAGSNVSGEG
jgi:predicted O-methyltransferase YrrM